MQISIMKCVRRHKLETLNQTKFAQSLSILQRFMSREIQVCDWHRMLMEVERYTSKQGPCSESIEFKSILLLAVLED